MTVHRKLCVIIPVHKSVLSEEETLSLHACYRHLKAFDCFLVFPKGLPVDRFLAIHPGLIPKPVAPSWLSSLANYNRMKLSVPFYQQFADYEFMMTYELDAYIFSSKVHEHHGFDFDFIGAPVFEGYLNATPDAPFHGALNSGFSVRNIQSCLSVLKLLRRYRLRWKFYHFIYANCAALRKRIKQDQDAIFFNIHLKKYYTGKNFNEDMIWTQVVPLLDPSFKTAPPETAAAFSFEVNPERLYELNNGRLPLGCHAWFRFPFWKEHIKKITVH
ncbi:hypothetical protein QFZ51_005702 [Chitinophaga sp. W3I9]|uniref:DUF5672 family protein n=1 Tax=Chitinophaga sp. W3I9 TaxID=3373924 RepID=UPI003D1DA752